MVVRGVTLYLLLGYLIKDIPSNCTKGFQVSINSNDSDLVEGDDLILTCVHNLPDVIHTFGWKMNGDTIQGQNESELHDKKVLSNKAGTYICYVESLCGYYPSLPHVVTVENNSLLLLVVCGVSALVLVLVMGLVMKFKLKRDNGKSSFQVIYGIIQEF
ncbi:B-cell receptor CD22 [Dissostichus eleginoides]|uniref:B-cell receptor CD22 n=1 Tax=Dissostichus eleginoides TaxID=100907 RepID=A0AAD9FJH5_DISEL|nr:B-cell receptor CD22 [Dissostichus eleginoides]